MSALCLSGLPRVHVFLALVHCCCFSTKPRLAFVSVLSETWVPCNCIFSVLLLSCTTSNVFIWVVSALCIFMILWLSFYCTLLFIHSSTLHYCICWLLYCCRMLELDTVLPGSLSLISLNLEASLESLIYVGTVIFLARLEFCIVWSILHHLYTFVSVWLDLNWLHSHMYMFTSCTLWVAVLHVDFISWRTCEFMLWCCFSLHALMHWKWSCCCCYAVAMPCVVPRLKLGFDLVLVCEYSLGTLSL